MASKINAHRLFRSSQSEDASYLRALTLDPETEDTLRQAAQEIREALIAGFQDWEQFVSRHELVPALENLKGEPAPVLRPKFRRQGSFAYRTINEPAQTPPQEVDLDDGVFLPTSFLAKNGEVSPIVASAGYFQAVEAILSPLCSDRDWKIDNGKSTCVRIVLSSSAHIDLPLYAIPDEEFVELIEKAAMDAVNFSESAAYTALEFAERIYQRLRADQIMVAHRSEGWKESDPRKIEDWFVQAVKDHGPQLRRICRYLKGWRDYKWASCCLSSIAIMKCVVDIYDDLIQGPPDDRDDLALLMVAERLPAMLSGPIMNPVLEDQELNEGWAEIERAELVEAANGLRAGLSRALTTGLSPEYVVLEFRRVLGPRIPNAPHLIIVEAGPEAVKVLAAPAVKLERPAVPRTTSG